MMTDFLWAGEALIGSSWTGEKSSLRLCVCVCVWRKLYTYVGSEDDFNIWEFLCSPGAVLSQLKTVCESQRDFFLVCEDYIH